LHGTGDARIQPFARSIARPGGGCQGANKSVRTHGFLDERGALISQIDGEIKTEQKISLRGRAHSVLKAQIVNRKSSKFPRINRSFVRATNMTSSPDRTERQR
jgi:hypothetical protein